MAPAPGAPAAPAPAGPRVWDRTPKAKPVEGKVKVDITLSGAPAAGARTAITSNNRNVKASVQTPGRRGASMGAAA
jgi:hypothetical protein